MHLHESIPQVNIFFSLLFLYPVSSSFSIPPILYLLSSSLTCLLSLLPLPSLSFYLSLSPLLISFSLLNITPHYLLFHSTFTPLPPPNPSLSLLSVVAFSHSFSPSVCLNLSPSKSQAFLLVNHTLLQTITNCRLVPKVAYHTGHGTSHH